MSLISHFSGRSDQWHEIKGNNDSVPESVTSTVSGRVGVTDMETKADLHKE